MDIKVVGDHGEIVKENKLEKAVDIVMIDDDLALNTNPKNPRSDFFSKI